jgi:hypothetical protein
MMGWSTWTPLEGSPLIDAGTTTGITVDINNAPISGLGTDIGAGEYQYSVQANQAEDSAGQLNLATLVQMIILISLMRPLRRCNTIARKLM